MGEPPALWEFLWRFARAGYAFVAHPDVGSISSIVGAAVSIFVLLSVNDIRKRVLLKLRAPDVIKELRDRASAISNALQDLGAGLPIIEEQIELANVTLKNASGKVTGQTRGVIKEAMKEVQAFRKLDSDRKTREAVRVVYVQLLVSAQSIEHLIADFREEP